MKFRLLGVLLLMLHVLVLKAGVVPQDSVRVSLLTCAPGSYIYTLFGHTAIRYEDPSRHRDWVFNYGMFSFHAPNFIWRFVKGETDYMLGVEDYQYFDEEYRKRGSAVYQQELRLTPQEKQELLHELQWNSLEENRVYRYNFLFDNCTTRARDRIESCLQGTVRYHSDESQLSFRDIIHQYTKGHKWAQFGMDFCLGSQADKIIAWREQLFAPFYLLAAVDSAVVVRTDSVIEPLAHCTVELIPSAGIDRTEHYWLKPLQACWLLGGVVLVLTMLGMYWQRRFWIVDFVLALAAGLAGSVIAFLVFVSVHPAVSPNYLLWAFHPVYLLYLPYLIYVEVKKKKDVFQMLNVGILTLFIILIPFLPQKFNSAVLPLALVLWIRAVGYTYLYYRNVKKRQLI